jgi:hypothetical protein
VNIREIKLEIETTGPKCGGAMPIRVKLEKHEGVDSIVVKFQGGQPNGGPIGVLTDDGSSVKEYRPVFVHLSHEGVESLQMLLSAYLEASKALR